jgi:hypothetical protein
MSWDESLANLATIDRWRAAIGLVYPQDQDERTPGATVAQSTLMRARGT